MSYPPTNLHALIGSNGTGKTTLIKDMIKGICGEQSMVNSHMAKRQMKNMAILRA